MPMPHAGRHAARQRARAEGLLRRLHRQQAHRLRRPREREQHRRGGAATAACRSCRRRRCSTGSTAATARRSRTSPTRRQADLLGGHEPEGARPRGDAPGPVRLGPALRADPRRPAGGARQAHGQGRRVRRLQGRRRRLHRHLRERHERPRRLAASQATADAEGHATVTWQTDEPASSRVDYGRTTALGSQVSDSARVTEHSVELTGLSPEHHLPLPRDVGRRAPATRRSLAGAPATFSTPPGALVDDRASEFRGRHARARPTPGQTVAGTDGEVQLQPAVAEEFDGAPARPAGDVRSWGIGGSATTVERRARRRTAPRPTRPTFYEAPRVDRVHARRSGP